jgi:(p)ppGpp synthase/HD superfamily hydrolase
VNGTAYLSRVETPEFTRGSPLLDGAFRMADEAHAERRRPDHETTIEHPVAVAKMLSEAGFSDQVVAAGLLHDVVEDTTAGPGEIREKFGPEVAELVDEMTEHEEIEPYERRKAEHRERVKEDPRAAAIYAADKLASTRKLAHEDPDAASEEKLGHYRRTLETLSDSYPDLPFLGELREELDKVLEAR